MKTTIHTPTTSHTNMGSHMKRFVGNLTLIAALAAGVLSIAGCAQDEVDRVQTNLVDKSIFEGEWWYAKTNIDVDSDEAFLYGASGAFAPWTGDMSYFDISLRAGTMARIRWVIDEDFLFAYRAYEVIAGGNRDGRSTEFRGQPLAAWRITDHVNIQCEYNPVTGECTNVRTENGSDARWWQTKFMRVDWSQNLISDFYIDSVALEGLFMTFNAESVPLHVQPGSTWPDAWNPQFVRVRDETDFAGEQLSEGYRWLGDWPSGSEDTVHYMSFVTQEIWSPNGGALTPVNVTRRHAFLRVPPNHEYAAETQPHNEFDRFGIIRSEQRTYVRGGEDRDTRHRYCDADADCGTGGYCDTATHVCSGGLTSDLGQTDFLSFYRLRHNFYSDSLTDQTCEADWECDGRYEGTTGVEGSVCDRGARRCTIPLRDRPVRQVAYHLNPGFPVYLARSAFQTVGEWNEVFMKGQRAVLGRPLPSGGSVACQSQNPGDYCFCGDAVLAPEVRADMTCAYQYNPFQSPADAMAAGVVEPYDCYIQGPPDAVNPDSFDDYNREHYNYDFVGSECMFVLKANSCDRDPAAACEQIGDIRYQFFNYIASAHVPFCGVMEPLQDPLNGEAIVSPANMSGECLESIGNYASQFFPVLRGEYPEDAYFQGENIRGYFERLGRVEHPPAAARSGTDGYTIDDPSRPGLPADFADRLRDVIDARIPELQQLQGSEGRARILTDRMSTLAGTEIERRLVGAMGADGYDLMYQGLRGDELDFQSPSLDDDAVLDRISPFRNSLANGLAAEQRRWQILSEMGMEPPPAALFNARYWQYWADAFRGRPIEEADVRMRQAFHRGVMLHEVGHAIGMEHNFAASLDRNNYFDGYYNVARELPLPDFDEYDDPSMGGNANGLVNGAEWDRYVADLRRVRNERSARGAGNVMASSIMEYPGDLSDLSGLGRYDHATVVYNYFNRYEAYVGDPRQRTCATDADCGPHGACEDSVCSYNAEASSLDGIHWSDQRARTYWTFYRGGESCEIDTHCPNTMGSASLAPGQPIYQRCIANPRYARLPRPCGTDPTTGEPDRNCICSTFDEDFNDYVDAVAYRTAADPMEYFPTRYLFCTNGRDNDISWCSTFDAGESFREVVDHFRRGWEEGYPGAYFRRNRRGGPRYATSLTGILTTSKIYQHFLFRYFYEPPFRTNTGPLGFLDQYMASADAMNWFTELAQLPDVGSYALDAERNVYQQVSPDPDAPGADFSLLPGQGFYEWSAYQEGIQGFFRRERAGVFLDKLYGMLALTIRDWGFSYTIDERFYLNFYDLFGIEMTEFFGGLIIDDPHWTAPRVRMEGGEPVVEHVNWYRGYCDDARGVAVPCRGATEDVFPGAVIGGTSNEILRQWATILALSSFPVFYDTSFEQRLMVFKEGNGDGWDLPARRPDGTPICEFGSAGCTTPGYIRYTSDRLHETYRAIIIEPRIDYNLPEEQLGFSLLSRLRDLQTEVRRLNAIETPTAAEEEDLRVTRRELERNESYLQLLIEIQRQFGISSYL